MFFLSVAPSKIMKFTAIKEIKKNDQGVTFVKKKSQENITKISKHAHFGFGPNDYSFYFVDSVGKSLHFIPAFDVVLEVVDISDLARNGYSFTI